MQEKAVRDGLSVCSWMELNCRKYKKAAAKSKSSRVKEKWRNQYEIIRTPGAGALVCGTWGVRGRRWDGPRTCSGGACQENDREEGRGYGCAERPVIQGDGKYRTGGTFCEDRDETF